MGGEISPSPFMAEVNAAIQDLVEEVAEIGKDLKDDAIGIGTGIKNVLIPPPRIIINQRAYLKMYYFTKNAVHEIGGLLVIKRKKDVYYVKDVILIEQKATMSTQTLDMKALGKFITTTHKTNPSLLNDIKGWWHSHSDMGVFWSGQDYETMKKLNGYFNDYFLTIVTNKHNDMLCHIEDGEKKHDEVPYRIYGGRMEALCQDEIKQKVKTGFL